MKAFCIRRKIYVVYMLVLILLLGVILYGKWYHDSASVLAQNETTPTPYPPVMPLEEWQAVFRPTADCELPCWLGVVPGATTLDQAVDIVLTQFGGIEDPRERDDPSPNTMTFFGPGLNMMNGSGEMLGPVTSITLRAENRLVEVIETSFGITAERETIHAGQYFEISAILETHDAPGLIKMEAWQDEISGLYAESLVFDWQTIGLAVVYRRDYQSEEIDGLVCFTFDHLFSIDIYLYVPSDNTVETVVDESSYVNLFPDELSRISDLSNEELVELLLEYDGCLPNDLPISTWDEQRPLRLGSE